MSVSLAQPMRPAEIEIITQVNTNTDNLTNEIETRSAQYTQLHTDIENTNDTVTTLGNSLNTLNTTVTSLNDSVTTLTNKFPIATADIADDAITHDKLGATAVHSSNIEGQAITNSKIANDAIQAAKLSTDIQEQLTFLQTIPSIEFGTSNSTSVNANSHTVVDITFGSTKTEEPVIFPAIQCATAGVNLIATVQSVTNAQCSICITNLGTTDVSDITVDYLAISGR